MGCCSARRALLLLYCAQLVSALERQVLDFLGYQWAPIMINFFHIIALVLGLFGVIQRRSPYVVTYLLWTLLWVGWNVFVSCLYLELGGLSRVNSEDLNVLRVDMSKLHCGTETLSPAAPAGRRARQNPQLTTVASCWLEYQHIEVLHCAAQLLLGFVYACYVVNALSAEEDGFNFIGEFHHPPKPSQLLF
uniref:Sodium/potassium-transporting ATPase subunit beta-1-interacting protein n=1 Tax=Mola mola TaxID=94237 RepID=A0A3Q4BQ25_MOLML